MAVAPDIISPNADGDTDATAIHYSLSRSADVSIYFENVAGERFYFRNDLECSPGDYDVLWGGVVDEPRTVETSAGRIEILSRVLDDGVYRWVVEAVEDNGNRQEASGQITLDGGDAQEPELHKLCSCLNILAGPTK